MRIVWNQKGFAQLLRAPGIRADLARRAENIAEACGGEPEGFIAVTGEGRTRSRAAVIAASYGARRRNADDNTIVRALDAGRR